MNPFLLTVLVGGLLLALVWVFWPKGKKEVEPARKPLPPIVPPVSDGRGTRWTAAATIAAYYIAKFGNDQIGSMDDLGEALGRTGSSFVRKVIRLQTLIKGGDADPTDLDETIHNAYNDFSEGTLRIIAYHSIIKESVDPACQAFFADRLAELEN